MTTTTETREVTLPVLGGRIDMTATVLGSGPALVYFHPAGGLTVDPYVATLAERYTVYCPYFPGTAPGRPYDIHKVDDLFDAVLAYDDFLRALGLDKPIAVGQSFGGMMAAELASTFPGIFSKMVLLDPVGLWNDDYPVTNWITTPAAELPALLFHDPANPDAVAMFTFPDDLDLTVEIASGLVWSLGCTGKVVWPIPDKGLAKRLHRVTTPTLIVWGENDALAPARYADDFERLIANASKVIIPNCGHIPQVEARDELTKHVNAFLD